VCIAGALLLLTCAFGSAAPLIFSGNFNFDDDVVLIPFLVPSTNTVTISTSSFGDGSGGFEPILTLFDGAGNLIAQDTTGGTLPFGCGSRAIDPISGFCLDGFIQGLLNAGNYTLALTEWDNIANGPTLADGFPQTGNGNFTGPEFLGGLGSFILFDGSQRNSNWALQITGADVPEPGTAGLMLCAGLAMALLRRRARCN